MAEIINQIVVLFEQIVLTFGYPGIFLVLFLENVITPIPTEPLMPLAGILSAEGRMNFFVAWATAVSGALTGSLVLYAIGRYGGEPVVRDLVRRFGRFAGLNEELLDRGMAVFAKYGGWVILVGRFLPVVRPTASLIAGMSKMRLIIYVPATLLGILAVTFLWLYSGYLLGENWRDIIQIIDQYESVILAVAGVVGAGLVAIFVVRRIRMRSIQRS